MEPSAALSYEWSNGQLEGQVNRLKLIKRLMYGRAEFRFAKSKSVAPRKMNLIRKIGEV